MAGRMLDGGTNPDVSREKLIGDVLFVSASLVLRGRKLFPPVHFEETSFADYPVHTLTTKSDLGRSTIYRINEARKVLEYGWLQKFIIVISHDVLNPVSAVEVFTWSFEYRGADLTASFHSLESTEVVKIDHKNMENTMEQIRSFFATLNETFKNELAPLPAGCFPGLRLVYNNEKPHGFQPVGFKQVNELYTLQARDQLLYERNIPFNDHRLSFGIVTTLAASIPNKRKICEEEDDDEVFEIARSEEISNYVERIDGSLSSYISSSYVAEMDSASFSRNRRLSSASTGSSVATVVINKRRVVAKKK